MASASSAPGERFIEEGGESAALPHFLPLLQAIKLPGTELAEVFPFY